MIDESELTWKTVLLIDDSELDNYLLGGLVGHVNLSPLRARSCTEGIKLALEHWPIHLILVDVKMPVVDGWQCGRLIRAEPRLSRVPMVAITGMLRDGDDVKAREAGFDGYEEKPMQAGLDFVQKLRRLVKP